MADGLTSALVKSARMAPESGQLVFSLIFNLSIDC